MRNVDGSIGRSKVTSIVLARVVPSAERAVLTVSPARPTGPWVLAMIRGPAGSERIESTISSWPVGFTFAVFLFWFEAQNETIWPLTAIRPWWVP